MIVIYEIDVYLLPNKQFHNVIIVKNMRYFLFFVLILTNTLRYYTALHYTKKKKNVVRHHDRHDHELNNSSISTRHI